MGNNRIIKQSSIFVLSSKGNIENNSFKKILIISKAAKKKIRRELKKISHITDATIFPDFYGFAQTNGAANPYGLEVVENNNKVSDNSDKASDNKDQALDYYIRALDYHQKGEYKEALEYYNKSIELNPDYAEAYNNRGTLMIKRGQPEEAFKDFDKSIERNPNNPFAYTNRGLLKSPLEFPAKEALADFDKSIRIDPQYPLAYSHRGNLKREMRRLPEALEDHNKAIESAPL